jgi:alpha-D-xyloside xylohydrolase
MATAVANWGPPIDYTNPDAYAWWLSQLQAYADLGIEGYKLDYAEEVLVGAFGVRLAWRFFDGSDEQTMHRAYQLGYHAVYADTLPADGGLLLVRASVAGDQTHGVIVWPGDIDADLSRYGETVTRADGSTYVAVGGLPSAVVAGSSLGPSGFPLFGSDTGGYRHSPPSKETYIRWFEHTALSTCMQVGTNTNDLPWALGPAAALDQEVLDLYRAYARLHLRLFPTLWTYWQRVASDGRAIQRPLGLAHPELGAHPAFDYLLGDDLLVAPVVDAGATTRAVQLPDGPWIHWFTGQLLSGAATVDAPLGRLPLLVRLWAPIPLLRPTIDTLSPVDDSAAVDSFASAAGPLWVRVGVASAPAADAAPASFALYDGTTLIVTPTTAAAAGCAEVAIRWSGGAVFAGAVALELLVAQADAVHAVAWTSPSQPTPAAAPPAADAAAFDDAAAAWLLAPDPGPVPGAAAPVWVKLPAEATAATVTVCCEGCPP